MIDELSEVTEVVTDLAVVDGYRRDQTPSQFVGAGHPLALVRPRTTAEVQHIMRLAAANRVPVVVRGAGSGLAGGANAVDGGLVLCTERMRTITQLDAGDQVAVVEAGVLNEELRTEAVAHGLTYAPDPASAAFSTIGGNVATNAGGLCCVKYGVTRESLLGVEVVTAGGDAVWLGRRTRKGVVGYDLTALMCGSQGTLGVITHAVCRLRPLPATAWTAVALFDRLADAGRATATILRRTVPSMLEIMDRETLAAVEAQHHLGLGQAAAMLLVQSDDETRTAVDLMAEACSRAGATDVAIAEDAAEGRMLTAARRLAYPSLERLGGHLLDDVAVPISQVCEFLERAADLAAQHDIRVATFGHAGDGNLHPTVIYDETGDSGPDSARAAFDGLVTIARALGGTASGEHGTGRLKRQHAALELATSAHLHRAVKTAFDPNAILGPALGP